MQKHGDWKSDAPGAISSPPRQQILPDGLTEFEHWIEFDTPQIDLADEMNGHPIAHTKPQR